MSTFQTLTVSSVLIAVALVARAADAQPVSGFTTLRANGAARGVVTAVRKSGATLIETGCKNPQVTSLANAAGPWLLLTTSQCLGELNLSGVSVHGPGLGGPFFFFRLQGERSLKVLESPEVKKVGILNRDVHRSFALNQVLLQLVGANDVSAFVDETKLLEALRDRKVDAIAVSDDGTGTASRELLLTKDRFKGNIQWEAWSPLKSSLGRAIVVDQTSGVLANDIVGADFVSREGLALPAEFTTSATLLRFSRAAPFENRPQKETGWSKLDPRKWLVVYAAELPLELPILVSRGLSEAQLAPYRAAVSAGSLWAPIDGGINPCHPRTEDVYNAFVRVAAANDPARVAPLWEHADMRALRGSSDYDVYYREKQTLDGLDGAKGRRALLDALGPNATGTCRLSSREAFSARFGDGKLAYYRRALLRLQDYFNPSFTSSRSDALAEAAVCLTRAVRPNRDEPTCGEGSSGMWLEYYAPYLAAAVVREAKSGRVP